MEKRKTLSYRIMVLVVGVKSSLHSLDNNVGLLSKWATVKHERYLVRRDMS